MGVGHSQGRMTGTRQVRSAWQYDEKRAAFVLSAIDLDVALMRFDKRLGQTETQAISACRAAPISTIKSVKDMGKIVFIDSNAAIVYANLDVRTTNLQRNANLTSRAGVFERIIDQICQDTLESSLIACKDKRI